MLALPQRLPSVLSEAKRWIPQVESPSGVSSSSANTDYVELAVALERSPTPEFTLGDGWAAVAMVNCRNAETGELAFWARDILALVDSYAEIRADQRSLLMVAFSSKGFDDDVFSSHAYELECRFYSSGPIQLTGDSVGPSYVSDQTLALLDLRKRLEQLRESEAVSEANSESPPQIELAGFGRIDGKGWSHGRTSLKLRPNEINRYGVLWEFALGSELVDTIPVRIQFGRSNTCNFKCVYCSDHREGNTVPRSQLDGETWDRLMRLIPRSGVAAFHGISEFLLDPEFFAILRACADAQVGVTLNTNGSVCTSRHIEAIAGFPGHLEVVISVDAATADTYKRIRGWDFDRLLENIKRYMDAFKKRTDPYVVGLSFVITRSNVHEMVPFIYLAKELGVNSVQYLRLNQYESLSWEIIAKDGLPFVYQEECPSSFISVYNLHLEKARRTAKLLEIEAFIPPPLTETMEGLLPIVSGVNP